MNLDGQNDNPPTAFSGLQKDVIWEGLFTLAASGNLPMIDHVREELGNNWVGDLSWVTQFPRIPTGPGVDLDLDIRVQNILGQFQLINPRHPHTKDPGDPWLIALAQQQGYEVVTDELDRNNRRRRRTKDYIPDVCSQVGVTCYSFLNFLTIEQII